jgi:uncharacterized protein
VVDYVLENWKRLFQFSSTMISRPKLVAAVVAGLENSPVTTILGPRQCGKTTLAREICAGRKSEYFDLENPRDQARLENPQTTLEGLRGVVVLDEFQRRPELMPLLRVLADRRPLPCRFLLLGSASPQLMKGASETLAGRVRFVDMGGFTLEEIGAANWRQLWVRGGFPDSYLAGDEPASMRWRQDFVRTFLERDLPMLGVQIPAETMRRFWTMLAHYHGQTWNASGIGASLGVSHHTTRRYLDALAGAYVVRQLPPWFENVGKRVVKSAKAYIRDTGILHALLNIPDLPALQGHPKLGASWEGFALEEVLSRVESRHAYFWATHGGAELDLMVLAKGKRWGFEFKYQDAPTMTKSMHTALADLKLERLWVVYPGEKQYALHERVDCVGLNDLMGVKDRLA